ncbi:MAG: phage integrase N-terminal SAM-like domain-containing protein [Verrucomicrobiota bacterium]|jgi:hypothetical protein
MNTNEAVRRLTETIRRQHLALATERTYCAWLRRYCDFLKGLPLHLPIEHKLERFLAVLAQKDVAASTQNQAFNPIISKLRATRKRGVLDCPSSDFIRAEFIFKRATAPCRALRGRVWRHRLPSVSQVADMPQPGQRATALP